MKTAWFNNNILPALMLNPDFKPLQQSDHFAPLKKCFSDVQGKKLLDLGCGAAEVYQTFKNFEYTGADLPHIIEEVAKKKNPTGNFIHFNAEKDDFSFLKYYDIILMNSFISEVPGWYRILLQVLYNSNGYIILHRQEVTDKPSYLEKYITYGGLETVKSIINYDHLVGMFHMNDYQILYEEDSFPGNNTQKTFLLRKNAERLKE